MARQYGLTGNKVTWPQAEDQIVIDLYPDGGIPAVREKLPHRTEDAVSCRAKFLKVRRTPGWQALAHPATGSKHTKPRSDVAPQRRGCLMCGGKFKSEWAGNRICKPCKASLDWCAGDAAEPYAIGGGR